MEQVSLPNVFGNPLSSAVRAQERVSYIREDDAVYSTDGFLQQQAQTSSNYDISSRPHDLSLLIETPDEVFSEGRDQNYTYEGNIAYVKPITREILSPIEGPIKFQSGQDEFLIFGTSRRLRSQFYDGVSKEDVQLREQKVVDREANLQRQIEEGEKRRRIERIKKMEQEERFQKSACIDDDSDNYDEEIIEDIITTRRKPQVQASITPMTYYAPEPAKVMSSVGVGDADVNQHFLLDTGSHSVNPADFPPVYWERLSRYFTQEIKRRRPLCRDAAVQLTPVKQRNISQAVYVREPRAFRNFGVCVKPITSTRGFTTDPALSQNKRNSGCMTDDLDEYFARLLQSICSDYPNADRTFIANLYRYSHTDISLFIRRLVERLDELKNIKTPVVPSFLKPRMCSVGLDVRPMMLDKRTLSEPPRRQSLGTNTKEILRRTQGSSTPRARSPDTFNFSGATDSIRRMDTGSQTKLVEPTESSSSVTLNGGMVEAANRKVTTYRIKRVSGQVDKEGKVSTETFETSGKGKPPPSALLESLKDVIKSAKPENGHSSQHASEPDSQSRYYIGSVTADIWNEKSFPSNPLRGEAFSKVPMASHPPSKDMQGSSSRTVEVARSPTFSLPDESEHQQFKQTPVQRTMSPSSGGPHAYPANSHNIPLRNYTYKVTAEMRKAVEALSDFYSTSPGGILTDDLQPHLEVVRKVWFDIVSKVNIEIEQVEDLFAFLYNSAPQLLYLFIRMPTTKGSTCLHYAVGHGAWRVVSLILNTGYADANKKNAFGFSPIMIAAISDSIDASAVAVLDRLFAAGDVNARAETAPGQTPLMLAARKANTTVVELLLRHGADVNAQDGIGNTALMCAIDCGNLEMVKLLVAQPELNIDLKDQEGSTALSIAEAGGNADIIGLIREKASIYKSDLTYHITSSNRQLFEPRPFHIVRGGAPMPSSLTVSPSSSSTTVTSTKIATQHSAVQEIAGPDV